MTLRFRWAAICALLAVTAAAPARGQCTPAELDNLIASDAGAGDVFGYSAAVSGDTAVVGAYLHNSSIGAAYVFVRTSGVWTQQAKLTPSDGTGGWFGISVAVSGDTAVVGAQFNTHDDLSDAGAAYVFVRSGTVWTEQAKLIASDAESLDHFGNAVAVSGDTAVVGAHDDDHDFGTADRGSAYVFVRSGSVWTEQARLADFDGQNSDEFGRSVAVSDNTVLVGSRSGGGTGAAYVFVRSGLVWSQQTKLIALDAAAGDHFGDSVALSDDMAVVGSVLDDHAAGTNAGSAYVFGRAGSLWTQQAKLTASDAAAEDQFGFSVALSGDMVGVGSVLDNHAGGSDAGSAYVFVRADCAWIQQGKLTASDAAVNDEFGGSVALSSDTALVGAYFDDHAAGANAGSLYVYSLGCDNDGDGIPNEGDVCPGTPAGQPVDSAGRPLRDCNLDCTFDGDDIQCIVDELLGV